MKVLIELGLTAMLGLANSPWEKKDYQLFYQKTEFRFDESYYVELKNSSRTSAVAIDNMNPQTAGWLIALGHRSGDIDTGVIDLSIGHQSEHEAGARDKLTESYHFISVKYSILLD